MLAPGIRVVRGPDWVWQDQDESEGFVGTVCEIGKFGSNYSPEKTVVVNWDSGHRTNYRVGYQNHYDLIVVDNAQIGVKHPNILCDGCKKPGIAGIRFRCAQCQNYDLCSACYGEDIHDLEHPFIRYTTANSVGVRVPSRNGSLKILLKGIFVGACVVRGPDWEWGSQDGGEGKTGRVMEIRGWDNESCRSVANVSWVSGSTNVYRLGHKGNVDLKYIHAAAGGSYYRDHMPVLGQNEEQQPVIPASRPTFSVGDRVKVCMDKESLMKLQQGHGGWNPRMADYLSKIGTVHRITDKGDIRVQYDGCDNRWTLHPAALIKVRTFQVGDLVTIIDDVAKVQQLQKGHGEWAETMRNALGKAGKVIKVYTDGDLRVQQIDDKVAWTLNPKCVRLERSPLATATERSNSMMDLSHQRTDHVMAPLSGLSGSSAADKLVREAAQGKLEYVKLYLQQFPDQVDVMSGGKTCLQVAAHQGHLEVVRYLLNLGANVNIVDKEGDSTLHYAAFGNQPDIMKILLENNALINVLNASHCSALHISAHKKPPNCVRILLEFGADVNIQDSYGDTALHDAIGKENLEVVQMLCNSSNLDFTVRNNRGFNALHHAALKGSSTAAKRILQLARQLVDVKKDDGFAALHLAALNGHADVVEVLVRDGKANINIRNNRKQTPFLLAVSQGHCTAIEKLASLGCDVAAKDEDGDTAIHLCIIKKVNLPQEPPQDGAPQILEIYQTLGHVNEHRLMYATLCFLAKCGCPIEENNKGQNLFDYLPYKEMVLGYLGRADLSGAGATINVIGPLDDDTTYANVFIKLNVNGSDSATNSANNSFTDNEPQPSSSNPPTPLRRQQPNKTNRDLSTPSPSAPFVQHHQPSVESTADNASSIIPKKYDQLNGVQSRPDNENPTTSQTNRLNDVASQIDSNQSTASPLRNLKDIIQPHVSRKELNIANTKTNITIPKECIFCNEILLLVTFEPCQHRICCEDCSIRMKKCLSCDVPIEKRITIIGRDVTMVTTNPRQPSADRLRYLEKKIQEIEEANCCGICMERKCNVAYLCGHRACSKCSETLKSCHMCRKTIVKKINLY